MQEQTQQDEAFSGYAILELMGHRRLGGYVREANIAGAPLIRIDIPKPDAACWAEGVPPRQGEVAVTSFYSPSSMYAITPVGPMAARVVAMRNRGEAEPVSRWEVQHSGLLPSGAPATEAEYSDEESF